MVRDRIDRKVVQHALAEVINDDDEVISIYSGIWSFSHRLGLPASTVPAKLKEWIEEFVGSERTLIFPTYTWSFVRTRSYDPANTPSEVGVLSQATINQHDYDRTLQPIYSYTLRGPASAFGLQLPCSTSWGADGIMGWLRNVDARVCVLGVPWTACAYIHAVEEATRVPYRYFKTFVGTLTENGANRRSCSETMYVRSLHVPPAFDYTPGTRTIRRAETHRKSKNSMIPLESAKAKDIFDSVSEILTGNSYAFIQNVGEVQSWVELGKAGEMDGVSRGDGDAL